MNRFLRFYREIYFDRRNWWLIGLWYVAVVILVWCALLQEHRWIHADVRAAAFSQNDVHPACSGYDSDKCQDWLGELDQQRRSIAVESGQCQTTNDCAAVLPGEPDPYSHPVGCGDKTPCTADIASWYKVRACPMRTPPWSRPEIGVLRHLIIRHDTAQSCGFLSDVAARVSLREIGWSWLPVYLLVVVAAGLMSVLVPSTWRYQQYLNYRKN